MERLESRKEAQRLPRQRPSPRVTRPPRPTVAWLPQSMTINRQTNLPDCQRWVRAPALIPGRDERHHARVPRDGATGLSDLVVVSDEVREALEADVAVVGLETTLVAHGFPAPDGVAVGLASEAAVRAAGAVPATTGVLDGQIRVGLTEAELERFGPDARKLGPRDLAACAVSGDVGATTVGGLLTVARNVGIRFVGTGGIGGVHRGYPSPPDVSADLLALVVSPVAVACSGAKSLLDISATIEYLETLGIPIVGFRTDTLPLFYSAAGGPPLQQRVEDATAVARIADAHWRLGGCGLLARTRRRRASTSRS